MAEQKIRIKFIITGVRKLEIKQIKVSELKHHPDNTDFFQDMHGDEWEIFIQDVKKAGITSPLTVIEDSYYVVKGNQRLRAAIELDIDTVPCIMVQYDNKESEIADLIRDNVIRRDLTAFEKMKLIAKVSDFYEGRKPGPKKDVAQNETELKPTEKIAQDMNVSKHFVSMSNLYKSLSPEQQKDIDNWVQERQKETGKKVTQKAITEEMKRVKELEENLKEFQNKLVEMEAEKINIEKTLQSSAIERQELQDSLATMNDRLIEAETKEKKISEQLQKTIISKGEKSEEVIKLKQELEQAKSNYNAVAKMEKEAITKSKKAEDEIRQLKERNRSLDQELKRLESVKDNEQKVKEVIKQIQELEAKERGLVEIVVDTRAVADALNEGKKFVNQHLNKLTSYAPRERALRNNQKLASDLFFMIQDWLTKMKTIYNIED